jgi:predicted AlkP superfamily pyrophosphatase or phosphodiesterase
MGNQALDRGHRLGDCRRFGRKRFLIILFTLTSVELSAQSTPRKTASGRATRPKLVLTLVFDQFRYDYLARFAGEYKEGLRRLLTGGAVFSNARYEHFPTYTSVGHATLLTGAYPGLSGIVGNQWYDRQTGKGTGSATDDNTQIIGGAGGTGSSPHNLLVSTLGDEMKIAESRSKVFGISLKDYSIILATGHMADGVYWLDGKTGNFVTSAYYNQQLPEWVKPFNGMRPADRFKGKGWLGGKLPLEITPMFYGYLLSTPFGNELVEELAEQAIQSERLGRDSIPDLLVLSFSANDFVGHQFGPDSPQVHEMCLKTDQLLGRLFRFLES